MLPGAGTLSGLMGAAGRPSTAPDGLPSSSLAELLMVPADRQLPMVDILANLEGEHDDDAEQEAVEEYGGAGLGGLGSGDAGYRDDDNNLVSGWNGGFMRAPDAAAASGVGGIVAAKTTAGKIAATARAHTAGGGGPGPRNPMMKSSLHADASPRGRQTSRKHVSRPPSHERSYERGSIPYFATDPGAGVGADLGGGGGGEGKPRARPPSGFAGAASAALAAETMARMGAIPATRNYRDLINPNQTDVEDDADVTAGVLQSRSSSSSSSSSSRRRRRLHFESIK